MVELLFSKDEFGMKRHIRDNDELQNAINNGWDIVDENGNDARNKLSTTRSTVSMPKPETFMIRIIDRENFDEFMFSVYEAVESIMEAVGSDVSEEHADNMKLAMDGVESTMMVIMEDEMEYQPEKKEL